MFMVDEKPTWPAAERSADSSRTKVPRRAGVAQFADCATFELPLVVAVTADVVPCANRVYRRRSPS